MSGAGSVQSAGPRPIRPCRSRHDPARRRLEYVYVGAGAGTVATGRRGGYSRFMHAVKLNNQGQVTLPAEIRRALSLVPGATLNVEVEAGVIHLVRAPAAPKADAADRAPGTWKITMSEDFDEPLPGFDDWR